MHPCSKIILYLIYLFCWLMFNAAIFLVSCTPPTIAMYRTPAQYCFYYRLTTQEAPEPHILEYIFDMVGWEGTHSPICCIIWLPMLNVILAKKCSFGIFPVCTDHNAISYQVETDHFLFHWISSVTAWIAVYQKVFYSKDWTVVAGQMRRGF